MKAILHIGGEKTGTTTIQEFCRSNRDVLNKVGIFYPASLGISNHLRLTAYALDDDKFDDDIRKFLGLKNDRGLRNFRTDLENALRAEIRAAGNVHTVLMSNEHIQSRLVFTSEIQRLKELLAKFFSEIEIVVYLRRQDRVAVSHYSTRLKSDSGDDEHVFPQIEPGATVPRYFDYNMLLCQFEEVFGRDNIRARLFEPQALIGGDLLADFRETCAIPDHDEFVGVGRENESLSPTAIEFYKYFNKKVPRFVDGVLNPMRAGINDTVTKLFSGRGPDVSAAEALEFYEHFIPGNREVARRYFPEGEPALFTGDFTSYPDVVRSNIDPKALIEIATHLWIERSIEIEQLRLENYLHRFAAAYMKRPRQLPPPPNFVIGPHVQGNLAARWVGAMLYLGENQRAAEAAAYMEGVKALPAWTVARLFALLRLGDDAHFNQALKAPGLGQKVAACIQSLRSDGVDRLASDDMVKAFQVDEPIRQQVYKRLFEWLGNSAANS